MTLYRWEHDSLPFLPNFCFLRPWTGYLSWHSALKSLSNPTSYIATGTTEKRQHCQADSLGSFIKSVANLDIDPACPGPEGIFSGRQMGHHAQQPLVWEVWRHQQRLQWIQHQDDQAFHWKRTRYAQFLNKNDWKFTTFRNTYIWSDRWNCKFILL